MSLLERAIFTALFLLAAIATEIVTNADGDRDNPPFTVYPDDECDTEE